MKCSDRPKPKSQTIIIEFSFYHIVIDEIV